MHWFETHIFPGFDFSDSFVLIKKSLALCERQMNTALHKDKTFNRQVWIGSQPDCFLSGRLILPNDIDA